MKKILFLILTAAVLSLAACGKPACSHQWQEADCENAKICTLCAAREGEALGHSWQKADCETPGICSRCAAPGDAALGHSWQAATCQAPQVCSRCAATQGDTVPHDFGKLTVSGETMFRYCQACGKQGNVVPRDNELYLEELLVGTWTCRYSYYHAKKSDWTYTYTMPEGYSLEFRPDGMVTCTTDFTRSGYWVYRETYILRDGYSHAVNLHFSGGAVYTIFVNDAGEIEITSGLVPSSDFALFTREDSWLKDGEALLTGTWQSVLRTDRHREIGFTRSLYDDTVTFTFHQDGTFTGFLDKEISGIWCCIPKDDYDADDYDYQYLLVCDGAIDRRILYYSLETGLSMYHYTNPVDPVTIYYELLQLTPEERTVYAQGDQQISGQWQGISVSRYDPETDSWSEPEETSDHTLSITDSGHFTGKLATYCQGKWYYGGYDSKEKTYLYHFQVFQNDPYSFRILEDGTLEATVTEGNEKMIFCLRRQ